MRYREVLHHYCWLVLIPSSIALAQNPVPLINQPLVPTATSPAGSTFTLTVNGTGFVSGAEVNWNGTPLATTFVTDSQLRATVPSANIANPATASVIVINPAPGGGASLPAFFEITNPVVSPTLVSYVQGTMWANISSMVTGDFNGDGKLDLAFDSALSPSGELCIALGNGDGSFQQQHCNQADLNVGPSSLIAGDFNGDGKLDLAIANGNDGTNTIAMFLGNGDGTLETNNNTYPAGPDPIALATGDFNRDGKLDLAVVNVTSPPSGEFSILLGNGDGTFQAPVPYTVATATSGLVNVVIGDFNRDGNLDLVLSGFDSTPNFDYFVAGNGDGTFQPAVQTQSIYPYSYYSTAADFNGDGNLDLAVTNYVNILGVSILLGNGDGTFQPGVDYSVGTPGFNILCPMAIDDLNADGILDLIYCDALNNNGSYYGSVEGFLLGNTGGTFQTATSLGTRPAPPSSTVMVTGDFNGDGKVDMVVAQNDLTGSLPSSLLIFLQGTFGLASPSPYSITFGGQAIGSTSAPQTITLTNTGNATLNLSNIGIVGMNATDFAETNTCGATLSAGGSCPIQVTFTPNSIGTVSASIAISDSGPGSPQMVNLTGTASTFTLSPGNISFPSQYVGTSGLPQAVTLKNSGTAPVTITNVSASPSDFGVLNACGSTVPGGSSCAIGVFFDPAISGSRNGILSVSDSSSGAPQIVTLVGTGQDFTVATSGPATANVSPGQTGTYKIDVSPAGGFNQGVALTCSGAPAGSACSLSPNTVTLNGSSPAPITVSVKTTGTSAGIAGPLNLPPGNRLALWLALPGLGVTLVLGGRADRCSRRYGHLIRMMALICICSVGITWSACGGGNSSSTATAGTPAGTYNLTVTGSFTSGATTLNHTTKLTLIVQ